jgi:hypothetical protein
MPPRGRRLPGGLRDDGLICPLDTDGDAALSPAEADALPRLRGRFNALDVDGSSALSPKEFQADLHTPSQLGGGKGV